MVYLHIRTSRHRDCVLFSFPKTYKRRPQAAVSTTGKRVLENLIASVKKFPTLFWSQTFLECSQQLASSRLGQMDPIHAFPSCMFKIRFNIILPCTHSHSFGFNPENAVHFFFLPCMLLSLPIFLPHLIARTVFHIERESSSSSFSSAQPPGASSFYLCIPILENSSVSIIALCIFIFVFKMAN